MTTMNQTKTETKTLTKVRITHTHTKKKYLLKNLSKKKEVNFNQLKIK